MLSTRREFVAGVAAAGLSLGAWAATATDAVTPEAFGAKGDGRTNDTEAFAAMSAFVNARGGGTVVLRPVTYIVGRQERGRSDFAFAPMPIMHFHRCTGAVTVRGNGASLRSAAGLRYGFFDPRTGRPAPDRRAHPRSERASPYLAMIRVEECSGPVQISDVELDGNLSALVIGGTLGKIGIQIPAYGIQLIGNSGGERLERIHSHHHALDGLLVDGLAGATAPKAVIELVSDYNGRQGCSIVGGRGYTFDRCSFRNTGKGGFSSSPGAGVDIEPPPGRVVRDLAFSRCEFSDNSGPALGAGGRDAEGALFNDCTFVGTTDWAVWAPKPRFSFDRCTFVGAIGRVYGDPDPARATRFRECTFRDDPALSPTGEVFLGSNPARPVAVLRGTENVMFDGCRLQLTHEATLPFSTRQVIYSNCDMSQRSNKRSRPQGTYVGANRLSGNIDIRGSIIRGEVILNGRAVAPT